MAAEELSVRGLTGVDISLPIAGVGTRSYAFIVDWHIRLLLALAWLVLWLLGMRLFAGTGLVEFTKVHVKLVQFGLALPMAVLYFLYHPVLEVLMRGLTPGKRTAGVRIVTLEGAVPGTGALLMRNLFRLIDSLPMFYLLGLLFCLVNARRVRIGDLAAGTLLVIDDSKSKAASLERIGALVQSARVDPSAAALVQDLLDRWMELDSHKRDEIARSLLKSMDPGPPEEIEALDSPQLRKRLKGLVGGD